jgi:hypothetical protein
MTGIFNTVNNDAFAYQIKFERYQNILIIIPITNEMVFGIDG